jgi:hypothetical protein
MLVKLFTRLPTDVKDLSGPSPPVGLFGSAYPPSSTPEHAISTLAKEKVGDKVRRHLFRYRRCRMRHRAVTQRTQA